MKDRIAYWARDKEWIELRDVFDLPTFFYLGHFLAADELGDLVVRLSAPEQAEALANPGFSEWRVGPPGSPRIYLRIPAERVNDEATLDAWLDKALAFVGTLPPTERLITKSVEVPDFLKD